MVDSLPQNLVYELTFLKPLAQELFAKRLSDGAWVDVKEVHAFKTAEKKGNIPVGDYLAHLAEINDSIKSHVDTVESTERYSELTSTADDQDSQEQIRVIYIKETIEPTYQISYEGFCKLCDHDETLQNDIAEGRYVFANDHICINDALFVKEKSDSSEIKDKYQMNKLAAIMPEQCCMKLKLSTITVSEGTLPASEVSFQDMSPVECLQFYAYGLNNNTVHGRYSNMSGVKTEKIWKNLNTVNAGSASQTGKIPSPKEMETVVKATCFIRSSPEFITVEKKSQNNNTESEEKIFNPWQLTLIKYIEQEKVAQEALAADIDLSRTAIRKYLSGENNICFRSLCAFCVGRKLHPFTSIQLFNAMKIDFEMSTYGLICFLLVVFYNHEDVKTINAALEDAGFKKGKWTRDTDRYIGNSTP